MTLCIHDIDTAIAVCGDCTAPPARSRPVRDVLLADDPGPWFIADYHGSCSGCGEDITPGDEIRADGRGRWQRRECCGEDDDA